MAFFVRSFLALLTVSRLITSCAHALADTPLQRPIVIGHRGASGYLPEHTLASYQLAMEMGADFIEPDLVSTRDGVLVARHEPNILTTTDVASHPEFASRRTQKIVDGVSEDGFFIEDFTWAEVQTLRAVQPRASRDQSYNGIFKIPSLLEIIELVKSYEAATQRKVGLYPETKHPTYFRSLGLPLEENLLAVLETQDFHDPSRLFIQSFEVGNLRDRLYPMLRAKGWAIPLIQLFDSFDQQPYDFKLAGRSETYGDLIQAAYLRDEIARYAAGIGPWKVSLLPRAEIEPIDLNGDGKNECKAQLAAYTTPIIEAAHAAGLLVHAYTFRDEEEFLTQDDPRATAEYERFAKLGLDGFFSDFPDTAGEGLKEWRR